MADIADDSDTTNEDTAVNTACWATTPSRIRRPRSRRAPRARTARSAINGRTATITYTPNADFNGTDSFTYTVTSGGVTETATVNVTVTAVADIVGRQRHDGRGHGGRHRVLANDTFEDPAADGHERHPGRQRHGGDQPRTAPITYTPNADFNGTDSFTYTVTSGGMTETATVNVTVDGGGRHRDDSDTTAEDTAVDHRRAGQRQLRGSAGR